MKGGLIILKEWCGEKKAIGGENHLLSGVQEKILSWGEKKWSANIHTSNHHDWRWSSSSSSSSHHITIMMRIRGESDSHGFSSPANDFYAITWGNLNKIQIISLEYNWCWRSSFFFFLFVCSLYLFFIHFISIICWLLLPLNVVIMIHLKKTDLFEMINMTISNSKKKERRKDHNFRW